MSQPTLRPPAVAILIRHAQKTGAPGDRDLSPFGQERAHTMAGDLPTKVGRIDRIFAAKSSRKSERPRQTLEPLAASLDLMIDERFDTGDYGALASELLRSGEYHGEHVLICWRHDTLQQLAQALGASDAPAWGDDVYDRVWLLVISEAGAHLQELSAL